jgi:hypothetical protein
MSAPLLFLDVDGVVLPFGAELDDLGTDLGVRLTALPGELVWATAWEHGANREIAPRIGLPQLPVVEWQPPTPAQVTLDLYFNLHWKTRQVVEWARGRDFAWADDEVTAADREWVEQNHPGRALVHHVRALLGLTGMDFDVLGQWLRAVRDGEADAEEQGGDPDDLRPAAS